MGSSDFAGIGEELYAAAMGVPQGFGKLGVGLVVGGDAVRIGALHHEQGNCPGAGLSELGELSDVLASAFRWRVGEQAQSVFYERDRLHFHPAALVGIL